MKNRIFVSLITLCFIAAFAACAQNQAVQTSAGTQNSTVTNISVSPEPAVTKQSLGNPQSAELYPAYVMEGTEKKWGFINGEGTFVIEPKYENASDFQNGIAEISENDKWGLIDSSGKILAETHYSWISDFDGKKKVAADDSYGNTLIDEKGEALFRTEGSIDTLSNGLAAFSKPAGKDKSTWGYLDENGKVAIEPHFEWAQAFFGDRALVQIGEGQYAVIDKEGRIQKEISGVSRVTGLSGDTFVFTKSGGSDGDRYGYMTLDGKVLIDAIYSNAESFEDGFAIVNAAKDYGNQFGVINQSGEYVIPAKYPQITSLKNGIYAVPEPQEDTFNTMFTKKALFDKTGKQLTEFRYYDLERLENRLISATDETSTLLLDETGKEVREIPKAEGIGSIKPCGQLYKVETEVGLSYLTKDGKTVWTSDNTIRLDGGLEVKANLFRPDRCMMIRYPEITGLSDRSVQDKINGIIEDRFIGENKASNKENGMYTNSLDINFSAEKNKDLLIVTLNGYDYPIGAAHGQPYREDFHIDLKNGNLYTLADLFRKDVPYGDKVKELLKKKIAKTNRELGEQYYSEDIGNWEETSGYAMEKDALHIYFAPYAIACYAAGSPEFSIRYEELKDLIDTQGDCWNCFERDSSAKPAGRTEEISSTDRSKMEEALKNYENTMIEAINKNSFQMVEPWLYPDSSLYLSQRKLVDDLNRKQIRERLDGYSIERVETDNLGVIRVYVTEEIGIQYPGKEFSTKRFNWIYSLNYSYENQRYQLTYIEKWERE